MSKRAINEEQTLLKRAKEDVEIIDLSEDDEEKEVGVEDKPLQQPMFPGEYDEEEIVEDEKSDEYTEWEGWNEYQMENCITQSAMPIDKDGKIMISVPPGTIDSVLRRPENSYVRVTGTYSKKIYYEWGSLYPGSYRCETLPFEKYIVFTRRGDTKYHACRVLQKQEDKEYRYFLPFSCILKFATPKEMGNRYRMGMGGCDQVMYNTHNMDMFVVEENLKSVNE